MNLQISCVYCGGKWTRIEIEDKTDLEIPNLIKAFQLEGFIVEQNGSHIDTYCKKSCAAGTTKI